VDDRLRILRRALLAPGCAEQLAPVRPAPFDADAERAFLTWLFDRLDFAMSAAPRAALVASPFVSAALDVAQAADLLTDPTELALALDDGISAVGYALDAAEVVTDQLERVATPPPRRDDPAFGLGAELAGAELEPVWAGALSVASARTLDDAVELRAQGFALVPLRPADKTPHADVLVRVYGSTSWKPLRERPASEPELRAWYEADPELNIGIVTGAASGGLAVVDLDGPAPASLRHPPTPIVRTSRGQHVYTRATVPSRALSCGDLKSEGGYVVAPPSISPTGARYEWLIRPDEVPLVELAEVSGLDVDPSPLGGMILTEPRLYEGHATTVAELGRDPDAVAAMLPLVGVHAPLGKAFRCVLPGHTETKASASINPETLVYVDWHHRDGVGRPWYSLAEVYASQRFRRVVTLEGATLGRWWDRLAYDAGLLPVDVPVPLLPPDLTEGELRVARGLALLLALNWRHHPGQPAPYAAEFAAAWSGVSLATAKRALRRLRELDVIRRVDQVRRRWTMNLYMLGDGTRRARS
jgi:hypothetical protein